MNASSGWSQFKIKTKAKSNNWFGIILTTVCGLCLSDILTLVFRQRSPGWGIYIISLLSTIVVAFVTAIALPYPTRENDWEKYVFIQIGFGILMWVIGSWYSWWI